MDAELTSIEKHKIFMGYLDEIEDSCRKDDYEGVSFWVDETKNFVESFGKRPYAYLAKDQETLENIHKQPYFQRYLKRVMVELDSMVQEMLKEPSEGVENRLNWAARMANLYKKVTGDLSFSWKFQEYLKEIQNG